MWKPPLYLKIGSQPNSAGFWNCRCFVDKVWLFAKAYRIIQITTSSHWIWLHLRNWSVSCSRSMAESSEGGSLLEMIGLCSLSFHDGKPFALRGRQNKNTTAEACLCCWGWWFQLPCWNIEEGLHAVGAGEGRSGCLRRRLARTWIDRENIWNGETQTAGYCVAPWNIQNSWHVEAIRPQPSTASHQI